VDAKPGESWVYCAQTTISIALRIESMGYHLHGHDAVIEVCACASKPRAIDLVYLKKILADVASRYDHKPLWESLGLEEAVLEDLVKAIQLEVGKKLRMHADGTRVCRVKASVPGESVEYHVYK